MNFNNTIQESNKVFSAIVSKAWEDADFKQRLVSSPEATIEEFTGSPVQLPAGAKLVVNDQTDTSTIHLNIPPQVKVDDLELSDEQLEAVAGGDVIALGLGLATLFCTGVAGGWVLAGAIMDDGEGDCQ